MGGSPQGSVTSTILFFILVANLGDWVSKGTVITYEDDTTVYATAPAKAGVRVIPEKLAQEVL
ncbi:hypothetical protein TCAL_09201 [Tigriopus californicus]|uniref:Reverse transcriptase domain-containing protein n=1 Tax=Tigriopus californicus TaxID=6832 RepID=A0A553PA12_TIGCA|nr:hypothetical protein TCAL_09201 [Tigriopus californicus]|eukprot:TCALIF_09201-PA protein Name:"Protein of unknown function" AED:0.35 eAED:0.37 QI:0/-1/0/1/-1/1/1/0/62